MPPGDLLLELGAHYWWKHLIEGRVHLGVGISNLTFAAGVGFKLNLLEFMEDPHQESIIRGFQRGMLSKFVQNFMIFVSIDATFMKFPEAVAPQTYLPTAIVFQPGAGCQWYLSMSTSFARRFYVETSLKYMRAHEAHFMLPVINFGMEMR